MKQKKFDWGYFLKHIAIIAIPVALQNLLTTTGSMVDHYAGFYRRKSGRCCRIMCSIFQFDVLWILGFYWRRHAVFRSILGSKGS